MAVTVASISKTLARLLRSRVGCGGVEALGGGGAALYLFSSSNHWNPSPPFCSTAAADVSVPIIETPPSLSPQPQGKGKEKESEKERGSGWSRWLLFLPGAICFGLGTWQIFRRQEKIKMLDYRQKRLALEPLMFNAPSLSSEQLDDLEFRRVSCKGVLDEKRSIYVGPRSRSISGVTENGYYVITPLMPIPNNLERSELWAHSLNNL
uniref:SURF1-like protein n=1 Tax=Rhizophora mucronata TaxID=61149 RepID=A0A2P2J8Z8_RHIMU